MKRVNQDTIVAIVLLALCGVFFYASFDIRQPDYGVLLPSTWPRIILAVLSFLCLIYLVQSLHRRDTSEPLTTKTLAPSRLADWIRYWKNPLWCFALFLAYLITLPVLGMLAGGIAFVFILQSVLGGGALVAGIVVASFTSLGSVAFYFYFLGPIGNEVALSINYPNLLLVFLITKRAMALTVLVISITLIVCLSIVLVRGRYRIQQQLSNLTVHAPVAILSVGSMWSVFTYGLDVMLPSGMIIDIFR